MGSYCCIRESLIYFSYIRLIAWWCVQIHRGGSCGASGAVRRAAGTSGLNPTMTRGASGQLRGVDIGGAAVTDGEKL